MKQGSLWMMHLTSGSACGGCGNAIANAPMLNVVGAMSAVVQVTQSPTFLSLQVRDTAIIKCHISGCAAQHYVWNKIPEFENGTQGFKEDLLNGSRISISFSGTLRIENLTVFDNGLYYCTAIYLCVKKVRGVMRSNGTRLTVTVIPSLYLQSNLSSNNSELLILTCTALGFYPSRIILSWHHSLPGVPHTTSQEAPRLLPDGTYSSSSTLQVNTSLWLPGTKIGCEATHTSMARPLKKYIRNSVEKINAVKKYWYSLAFLVFPVILGGIYLLLIFSRSSAATEPSECIHEEGNEMENELQYSTFFHKNLKKYASSQNENDFKCIYSDVKMKEGGLTECKQGVDYAVLDICETPNVITKKSL